MVRRFGAAYTVLWGTIIDVIGMSIFLYSTDSWQLAMTGLFLASVGGALWATTILGLLSKEVPAQHQGAALGIANGAGLVGRVNGPWIAGLIADRVGPRAPFILIFVCVCLALLRGIHIARKAKAGKAIANNDPPKTTR
jgi:MFS family permease